MHINLNDAFGLHLWWLWLVLAAMLAALELLRKDRTIAVSAVAALIAALAALILPKEWLVQLAVFVILTIVGELVLKGRRVAPMSEKPLAGKD